ncbi:C45 family autoproteolytic acyltransferase/hydolase [Acetivibrio clariflavus]|uniref:C45 family autoproteolytic acyltransferase/hydolase n=1 Tax=Acetivibrio clariflavus TaxID=288965 RepID=UPI0004864750|nr:C45 family autoproteolytic acyltransferase/hydolase [Acetivibrio clariflavus]
MKCVLFRNFIGMVAAVSILLLPGCNVNNSPLTEHGNNSFESVSSKTEEAIEAAKSSDGLAVIDKKESYYEVTLNLEKGSHYDVGKAYGKDILQIYPHFIEIVEMCLYKNVGVLIGNGANANILKERLEAVVPQIPKDYVDEINGFVDAVANGKTPFQAGGKLSREEIFALNLLPDIIRGTQCSGMAVLGSKSQTGSVITGRILEWFYGSEKQFATMHSVVTFKNFDKTITTIGFLGTFNVITAINDDGVFLGILDADTGEAFDATGKRCYTYEIRKVLEDFTTAEEVAEYTNSMANQYTFSHNLLITDSQNAFVAENCVSGGKSGIRTAQSKLAKGLKWNNEDLLVL